MLVVVEVARLARLEIHLPDADVVVLVEHGRPDASHRIVGMLVAELLEPLAQLGRDLGILGSLVLHRWVPRGAG